MSLINVKARVECDVCGLKETVDLDPAEGGNDLNEIVLDTLRGGGLDAEGWSYYEDKMRCKKCTTVYLDKWTKDHPTFVSGVEEAGKCWSVTTYDDRVFLMSITYFKPEYDSDIRDHPAWPNNCVEQR